MPKSVRKKPLLSTGGAISIGDAQNKLDQRDVDEQVNNNGHDRKSKEANRCMAIAGKLATVQEPTKRIEKMYI